MRGPAEVSRRHEWEPKEFTDPFKASGWHCPRCGSNIRIWTREHADTVKGFADCDLQLVARMTRQ